MILREAREEMQEILDQVSDETGEEEIDNYLLKYEGWSPVCFPPELLEEDFYEYASQESTKVHKEWRKEMRARGYVKVEEGHEPTGLYGVTYALYRRKGSR